MTILEIGLGKYPFQTENHHPPIAVRPIELVQCIVYETPAVLPADRGYSPELAALIQQCLAKKPLERPTPNNFLENPLLRRYHENDRNQSRTAIADFFNGTTVATGRLWNLEDLVIASI